MSEEADQGKPHEDEASEAQAAAKGIIPFTPSKAGEPDTQEAEEAAPEETTPGELSQVELKGIVEALLFATSEPINPGKLAKFAGVKDARALRDIIEELKAEYAAQTRAFTVEEIAGGYQLMTLPDFHTWVGKLREKEQEETLSQAALETLAIVAYRQPITRAEIEDVRGVQSGYILRSLIEKALVRVTGRKEELGRPLLYGTAKKFLDAFGLGSLAALPTLAELEAPSPETGETGDGE